ncbi:putative oxidoreductase protein [Desulfamplus magnetovallimortis]|uniref:Putative oxidoreductase protein n=1 Tax=Desulfamplus magnetovallimortis TaxID=1246637 RepID=A0A1W1HBA1_9BACT|nr:FAD-binding oxidoreductase [Desulfamplus magnetovallimortis]SLM29719.1 putative oxidoreductase protein [Desulfamplus magnetovallimortis]
MDNRALSHGLWDITAAELKSFESIKGEKKTDVAIIGGGYTGLSAALHLAEKGADALLLEAKHIGFGGAGRNVGLVNAGLWLMPSEVVDKLGSDVGEELIKVLGASPDLVFHLIEKHNIKCEAVRTGTLHCAHSKGGYRALEQREAQWQERGAPVTLLDREKAAPLLGSNAYHGALLDKRAGTVQPLAYAYGLAKAASDAGAHIYTDSPVVSINRDRSGWKLKTPDGTVHAKAVILAVQGYADHAFKNMEDNLIPFNYFQFATPPLPEDIRKTVLPGKQGAWDTNLVLSSYRLDLAGRLILGSVGQVDSWGYTLHKNWAERTLERVFPQIGKVPLEHGWYGRIAMTPNHIPRFHILGPDFVSVTSYNGRGIGPGSVFGKLLAAYIKNPSSVNIPLPVSEPAKVFMRDMRGLYYEAGARIYHMAQRRTGLF